MKALLTNWTFIHTVLGMLLGGFVGFFASPERGNKSSWSFFWGAVIGGILVYAGLTYCKCYPLLDLVQRVKQF